MGRIKTVAQIVVLTSFFIVGLCSQSSAALWGTSAIDSLTGSRSSSNGIAATESWDNGGFTLSWNIYANSDDTWTYEYTTNVTRKDPSHFILEVSEGNPTFSFTSTQISAIEGPTIWTKSNSNPSMPYDIYGVKFDFGGDGTTYSLTTNRAPVWGVFYAKDGKDGGDPVVAWSNALDDPNYKISLTLSETDFIVRPDAVPVPGTVWLLFSSLLCIASLKKRNKRV